MLLCCSVQIPDAQMHRLWSSYLLITTHRCVSLSRPILHVPTFAKPFYIGLLLYFASSFSPSFISGLSLGWKMLLPILHISSWITTLLTVSFPRPAGWRLTWSAMCPFTWIWSISTWECAEGSLCCSLPSFVTSAFASHLGHLRISGMVCWLDLSWLIWACGTKEQLQRILGIDEWDRQERYRRRHWRCVRRMEMFALFALEGTTLCVSFFGIWIYREDHFALWCKLFHTE